MWLLHVRVVALYAGAFLDGVYIDNAPDQAIAEEARALAVLGRISDAERAITEAAALRGYQNRSVGSAMYYTRLEMRVHGHKAAAHEMFARTISCAVRRTADEPGSEDAHRMLALAHYSLENWQAADSLFRIQLAARPRNIATMGLVGVSAAHCGDTTEARRISDALKTVTVPYSRGVNTMWPMYVGDDPPRRSVPVVLLLPRAAAPTCACRSSRRRSQILDRTKCDARIANGFVDSPVG